MERWKSDSPTPVGKGRYVGAEEIEDDGEPFDEKMPRRVAEPEAQFAESAKLEKEIRRNLSRLSF